MERGYRPHLGLNVVANYAGKLWGITSIYVFVPVYVQLLGMDAYGLIAFNGIVLAILFIADAGLSAAFAREAARIGPGQGLLNLLKSVELILFSILLAVGLLFILASPLIASAWLNVPATVSAEHVVQCVWLMGISFIPQIAMSLYFGGLMGLQRQVSANLLWTAFSMVRSGLVILPIYFFPDIRIFFAWQAISSVLMLMIMRHALKRHLSKSLAATPNHRIRGEFSWPALRSIQGYAAGMLGMSIISALNMQMDKLIVSKMLPLSDFAEYSLASTLAQIPYILTLPIAAALLPRLTNMLSQPELRGELTRLYRDGSYYIACVGAVTGIGLVLFAPEVFALWMPKAPINEETISAARLLAIGGLLLTLQMAPFQLSLANGHQATNLGLGIFILTVAPPLQIFLTSMFGMQGAATPWLLLNLVAFVYLGVRLNLRFPLVSLRLWFLSDAFIPILPALLLLMLARLGADSLKASPLASCMLAGLASLIAIAVSYAWRRRTCVSAASSPLV